MKRQFICNIIAGVSGAVLLFFHSLVWALNWTIRPSLEIEQIYSDNINQESSNKKAAFVTELSPGFSVNGTSSISQFDFSYRMQNLYNAGGGSGLDINHQLQMNTNYEFVSNRLFLDSSSTVSQQNTSNRRTTSDNISDRDSTTVSTFQLSPYWTPHFGGFADGELRVTYDRVNSEGGNSTLSQTDALAQNIRLTSGTDFSLISWSFEFNNSNRSNSDGEDVSFQNSTAVISYAIGRKFSVFARAGQSNNSFQSNSDNNDNGISYTFGGQWQPSQRFRLEAGAGNDYFVTVEITPFNRLHWITTYRNTDIGLNTGNTWNTALNYNTRRTVWSLTYSEQTVTTQQLLLNQQIFGIRDQTDNLNINEFNLRLPTLTDEVFITKTAELSFSFRTGKSDISTNIFRTIRDFEQSGDEEEVTGISASWNWAFSRRTNASVRSSWQQTESDGINAFSDERFDVSVALTRSILDRLNGNIEYRYTDQSSDDNLNSYSENRISASLSLQF